MCGQNSCRWFTCNSSTCDPTLAPCSYSMKWITYMAATGSTPTYFNSIIQVYSPSPPPHSSVERRLSFLSSLSHGTFVVGWLPQCCPFQREPWYIQEAPKTVFNSICPISLFVTAILFFKYIHTFWLFIIIICIPLTLLRIIIIIIIITTVIVVFILVWYLIIL